MDIIKKTLTKQFLKSINIKEIITPEATNDFYKQLKNDLVAKINKDQVRVENSELMFSSDETGVNVYLISFDDNKVINITKYDNITNILEDILTAIKGN